MTGQSQFALLARRRFAPLFVTQFLGAFHDNLFKNAFVVLLLYGAAKNVPHAAILVTVAAGVFILPYILFSATAGQLADRMAKDRMVRIIKTVEIAIALMGAASLLTTSVTGCFVTLFALGTHSAFFAPCKYALLPQHLAEQELIGGNAVLSTGTFLAILLGTVAGTSLMTLGSGALIVSFLLPACAVAGLLASRFIPPAPPSGDAPRPLRNILAATIGTVRFSLSFSLEIRRAIWTISWFWFLGGMYVAQLPNFVRLYLHADAQVLSLMLVVFSIGIAAGGLCNNLLLRGRIAATYVPAAMLGVTLFSLDLCAAASSQSAGLVTLRDFMAQPWNWRIVSDVGLIALCGGLFVVPLDAIVQHRTPPASRARMQAGNAIVNSVFIVAAALLSGGMIAAGFSQRAMFGIFAVVNAGAALAFYRREKQLPAD